MAQDTRKDTRAPVSLKVRFKSATVDEFIEQYSTDISRGGIFIKSKSPMPVGTLLKFEFELKDNSPLIHGVGRVVWKRDPDPAKPDMPPGMGIKFIKMDSQSRAVVERIVGGRPDGAPDDRIATPARPQVAARAAAASSPQGDGDEDQRTMVSKVPELMAQAIAQMPAGKEPATVVAASPPMPTMPGPSAVAAIPPPPAPPTAEAKAAAPAVRPAGATLVAPVAPPPVEGPSSAVVASWTEPVVDSEADGDGLAYEPEPPPPRVTVRPPPPAGHSHSHSQPAMAAARRSSIPPPPAMVEEPKRNPFIYVLVAMLFVGTALYLVMQRDETPPLAHEAREGRRPTTPTTPPTKAGEPDTPTAPNKAPGTPVSPGVVLAKVHVETTPAGAEVWVADASKGAAPLDLDLPVGHSVTVKARKPGYREASQEITPAEGPPGSVSLALEALPRVITITSEPAGASITIGGHASGRTPRDVTLASNVDGPVEVRLTRTGSEPFSQTVALDEGWSEVDGHYRYTLAATLTAVAAPVRPPGGGRPGGGRPGGGRPAGGGAEPGGAGAEPGGGGAEPGGGGAEPPPPPPPDNPPPPPPPPNNGGGSPVPDNPFGK